jgi:hypothetical protein
MDEDKQSAIDDALMDSLARPGMYNSHWYIGLDSPTHDDAVCQM